MTLMPARSWLLPRGTSPSDGEGAASMNASVESGLELEPRRKGGAGALLERINERPQIVLTPLFAVLFFGGWEYACHAFKISQLIIPAPSQIVVALVEGFRS